MSRSRRAVVRQLAFAPAQRPEGGGAVLEQLRDRQFLAAQGAEEPFEFGEGRFELAERVGEVLALPFDRHRRFLHPGLEGGAGLRVEGAEDLVELDRLGDVGLRQRRPVDQPLAPV
jgi:hypothetical protein